MPVGDHKLGVVGTTRKDRRTRTEAITSDGQHLPAPVRSRATLCYDILREVQRESMRSGSATAIYVNTTPAIADMLYGEQYHDLQAIEQSVGQQVVVRPLSHFHPEQYEVYAR